MEKQTPIPVATHNPDELAVLLEMAAEIDDDVGFDFEHYWNTVACEEWIDATESVEPRLFVQWHLPWGDHDADARLERLHLIDYLVSMFDIAYVGEEVINVRESGRHHTMEFVYTGGQH